MGQQRRFGLWSLIVALFRAIDFVTRSILAFFVLAVLVFMLALLGDEAPPTVPDRAALVLAPRGEIVDQLTGDAFGRAVDELVGEEVPETLLRDLTDAVAAARDDDRIQALVLDLGQMSGAGLSTLQELRRAVEAFKESGKPVIATADFYGNSQYHLAAPADEIYLHQLGLVVLDGYGRFRNYHRDGIERLEIEWNVFKVGEYKSAVEPYLRNDMSESAREANRDWLGDLWSAYLADVAAARGLTPEGIADGIERFDELLAGVDGDGARLALDLGWVDHVGPRDAVRERLIEVVGEDDPGHSFPQVDHGSYLEALGGDRRRYPEHGDAVAVVVARGPIVDGDQPPGSIGGDSTAALVREARADDRVRAIVLRVDSGGGSAFASEVIRRELELARQDGKKVVVSMGDVAASGGYWISTSSDEIWASPTTITGSIGIFGMLPTFQKPLAKYLGTRTDGVGTTWLSGAFRLDRPLQPRLAVAFQRMVERGYEEFLTRVADSRGMSRDEVDQVARGRVWSGADAHRLGLVDQLGDLDDAIAAAAALAELEEPAVRFVEPELSFSEQLMIDLMSRARSWAGSAEGRRRSLRTRIPGASFRDSLFGYLERQAELLARFDDPAGLYAACLCEVE